MKQSETNYISDSFKEMTDGAESGKILKILSNLSAEIIARISLDIDKDYKELVEEFKDDIYKGACLFIDSFKLELH